MRNLKLLTLIGLAFVLSACTLQAPTLNRNINQPPANTNQNTNTDLVTDPSYCQIDTDCVKATCCHPRTAVNKSNAPSCTGIACDLSCQGPLDCGAGKIVCENNKCTVKSN